MIIIKEEVIKEKASYQDAIEYIKNNNYTKKKNIQVEKNYLNNFYKGLLTAYATKNLQKENTRVLTILGVNKESKQQVLDVIDQAHVEIIKVYNPAPLEALNFCIDFQYDLKDALIIPVNETDVALEEADFVLLDKDITLNADNIPAGTTIIGYSNDELVNNAIHYSEADELVRENDEDRIFYEFTDHAKELVEGYLLSLLH